MTPEQIRQQAEDAGMSAFRSEYEYEDENQHLDDAVRLGILVALRVAVELLIPQP